MKKIYLLLAIFAIGLQAALGQTREITGTVTSAEDGSTLPGVSVSVKGTTLGTITDIDGKFLIKAPQNAQTLVFSFVGMQTKEVAVTGNIMNVQLEAELVGINEVVVTALGISREKKSLGYAVQEVSGEELNNVKNDNFINSLSGRVSGIQIKNNTNFGGSTNVIIRGSTSLTGNNQALFVVDGIPIDNSNTNNSGQLTGRNGYDYGNSAADINPNDIESISVLKGAAATALYGSRAARGVVLITTKKGKATGAGAPKVKVSSNVTLSSIDKKTFPKYQNESGGGYGKYYYSGFDDDEDGEPDDGSVYPGFEYYADVNGDGATDYTVPYYEDASRGQKFDPNLLVYQWDALDFKSPNYMKATPWVAGANGPDSFFETGLSTSQNVEVSGGDDNTTYRFSYTYFDQNGVMPNSRLVKNNVMFNGSQKILDRLKITTSANYIKTEGKGRPSTGYSDNIMSSFRQWYQTNVDLGMQKYMYEKTGRNVTWNPVAYDDLAPAYWDNPYWVRYENYETDSRSRLIGYIQLDWDITSNLKAMGRYAIDTYSELQEERKAVGSAAGEFGVDRPDVTSGYSRYTRFFTEKNIDFMLNYHKTFNQFDFTALLGTNIRRTKSDRVFESTNNGLAVPQVYALSNSVDPMLPPEEDYTRVGVNGVFGSVSLGYKNTYFIDATLRRDQSSTLPEQNNAYYYPSVTGSFIFSELVKADWLSLGKVRLNYAEVGSAAPALSVKDTYEINASFAGTTLVTLPDTKQNALLKPERQTALEGGLEMNFLRNRVGFDLAFYKNNTKDQLMPVSVSFGTGYSSNWVNAGEIENKGIELALFGAPVKTRDFSWDIRVNWAKNKNKVVKLYTDESGNQIKNLVLGSLQGGVSINASIGEPYGTIKGSDFQYHEENGGKIISGTSGRYLKSGTNDIVIGNINPDWTAGITNSFKYKNLTLSFLVDVQKGGDVFSLDLWYGMGTGLYEETAGLNDLGNLKRDPIAGRNNDTKTYAANSGGTVNEGVLADGTPNWVRVSNESYGALGWAVDPNKRFVYDASYVKLRELTLTYDLPKEWTSKLYLAGASVGFVGSNLWILHKNLPHADPEASQSSGNIQGWQSGVMPATRNYGFTLNLQF